MCIHKEIELLIIPTNHMMEPLSKNNYKYRNKKISMLDGDIKIIAMKKLDIMYIKFPFRYDNKSKDIFVLVYNNMIQTIYDNEYKRVVLSNINLFSYGYSMN
jgi:hypothetical protein